MSSTGKRRPRMRLFIWREVLCDYTCGIAFAVAEDVTQARALLAATTDMDLNPAELAREPEIHELDKPYGTAIYGGG